MDCSVPHTKISLGAWEITVDAVEQYLAAVGDKLPIYLASGAAPPLMLAARVVGRLLERLALPDGAVHNLQDVATLNAPRIGAPVSAEAQLEPARERGGMRFLTVNFTVTEDEGGLILIQGRTTILLPTDTGPTDD